MTRILYSALKKNPHRNFIEIDKKVSPDTITNFDEIIIENKCLKVKHDKKKLCKLYTQNDESA